MEKMKTTGFALYPSTLKRMRDFKKESGLSWDELFNRMIEKGEQEKNNERSRSI